MALAGLATLKTRADFLRVARARRKAVAPGLVVQAAARPNNADVEGGGACRVHRQPQGGQRGCAQSGETPVARRRRRDIAARGAGRHRLRADRAGRHGRSALPGASRRFEGARCVASKAAPEKRRASGAAEGSRCTAIARYEPGQIDGHPAVIRAYQLLVSPLLPPSCRYYAELFRLRRSRRSRRHGRVRGAILALRRLLPLPPLGRERLRPGAPGGRARAAAQEAERTGRSPRDEMDQRNLLLAIVLSVVILIGFQFVLERLHPATPPAPQRPGRRPDIDHAAAGRPPPAGGARPPRATAPAVAPTGERGDRRAAAGPYQHAAAARLDRAVGGRIDDLTLANYHETIDPKSPEVVLLWPSGTKEPYFAEFGWVASGGSIKATRQYPGRRRMDRLGRTADPDFAGDPELGQRRRPPLHARDFGGRELHVHGARHRCGNTGAAAISLSPYGLISRTGTPTVSGYYILFEGLIGELGGSLREVKYSSLESGQADRLQFDRRVARLYRQILADRARSAAERGGQGALHASRRGRGRPLPNRFTGPAADDPAGWHGDDLDSAFLQARRSSIYSKLIAPRVSGCSITRSISGGFGF